MTSAPITDAITIARRSVDAALRPLVATLQADSKAVRLNYARMPAASALPAVVHQSQDNGGLQANFLSATGWDGLWTVKVFANDITTADTWLAALVAGMAALALPSGFSGYSIQADYERPLVVPPDSEIYQSAAIWRVRIYRN